MFAYTKRMLTIILRSIIIYLIVLFVFRIMGKRQLGQMQPFELVLTLIIADLATIPMAEISVPVLHGIVPLFTLVILHFVLTLLTRLSSTFSSIVSGKPVIVINPNGIDYKAMKKLSITIDDIFEAMRGLGYFSLEQVEYAIMETNGKISVLPKAELAPATNQSVGAKVEKAAIPINIISEGKVLKENLALANLDENFLQEFLKNNLNKAKIKDVLVMTIDDNGVVYLQLKQGQKQIFEHVRAA